MDKLSIKLDRSKAARPALLPAALQQQHPLEPGTAASAAPSSAAAATTQRGPVVLLEPLDTEQYGLQVRRVKSGQLPPPEQQQSACSFTSGRPQMDAAFALQHDLKRLPQEMAGEEEDVYGQAEQVAQRMLASWDGLIGRQKTVLTEGSGSVSVAKPVQFVPRLERLGLGADPNRHRPEDAQLEARRAKRVDLVAQPGAEGQSRNVVPIDERLVVRESSRRVQIGSDVVLGGGGEHAGLRGRVHADRGGSWEVVLAMSLEHVLTPKEHASLAAASGAEESADKAASRSAAVDDGQWLFPRLIVKFASRTWRGGQFYNRKGVIEDVHYGAGAAGGVLAARTAMVVLQSDKRVVLTDVPAHVLSPVAPQLGRPCMLVRGGAAEPGAIEPGTVVRVLEMQAGQCVVQTEDALDVAVHPATSLCQVDRQ